MHYATVVFWVVLVQLEQWLVAFGGCGDCWSLDSEGLTGASLPIGKDGPVVPLHAAVSDRLRDLIEDALLVDLFLTNEIEIEFLYIVASVKVDGAVVDVDAPLFASRVRFFSLVERPDPDDYFDVVLYVGTVEDIGIWEDLETHVAVFRHSRRGVVKLLDLGIASSAVIRIAKHAVIQGLLLRVKVALKHIRGVRPMRLGRSRRLLILLV